MLPLGGFFQLGYVTTDLEAALALYRDRFGVSNFMTFDTAGMNPNSRYTSFVSLGWTGGVMVELIQPKDIETPLYVDAMPKGGFGINLHHLGYILDDEAQWTAAMADLDAQKVPIASLNSSPGRIHICYADTRPVLGHYLEYVWPETEGRKFLDAVPHN